MTGQPVERVAEMAKNQEKGEKLFEEGKIEAAEACFREILKNDPNNVEVLNNLGVIRHRQNDPGGAERFFLEALAVRNGYLPVLENLVSLLEATGKWPDAAARIEACILTAPDDFSLYNRAARIYLEMAMPDKAGPALEKSIQLNPGQRQVQKTLTYLKESGQYTPLEKPSENAGKPWWKVGSGDRLPEVSVGLPVFNGGKLLSQAIESILSQDFENFELVISDNHSTDETEEICNRYRQADSRIRYSRFSDNLGFLKNNWHVYELSKAPFFIWAAHDDMREKAFISCCLKKMKSDPQIAIVYPRTKLLNDKSQFIGIADDHLNTAQANSHERFVHLIWELGMCNAVYGLFRKTMLDRSRNPMYKNYVGPDNLLLAEMALMGKIVQIEDPLFVRRLTRNYNQSLESYLGELIQEDDLHNIKDGITLPHCRLTYSHLELLNYMLDDGREKNFLMNEVIRCFRNRHGDKMIYEIERAAKLIAAGKFFHTWSGEDMNIGAGGERGGIDGYHLGNLVKTLQEALFIYPDLPQLREAHDRCCRLWERGRGTEFTEAMNLKKAS